MPMLAQHDMPATDAPARTWAETVRGGSVVCGTEPEFCDGQHAHHPQHIQDVTHASQQIGVTANCTDGTLGVLMAYLVERPFDATSEIGSGPKLLVTFDEEHETRVMDLAGARQLGEDVRTWLAAYGALLDQFEAATVRNGGSR